MPRIADAATLRRITRKLGAHGSHPRSLNAMCGSRPALFSRCQSLKNLLASQRRLVSAARDGTIRVWNARNGAELHRHTALMGRIQSLVIAPDGRCIAAAGGPNSSSEPHSVVVLDSSIVDASIVSS